MMRAFPFFVVTRDGCSSMNSPNPSVFPRLFISPVLLFIIETPAFVKTHIIESDDDEIDIMLLLGSPSVFENLANVFSLVCIKTPSPFVPMTMFFPTCSIQETELEAKEFGSSFLYVWCFMRDGFSGLEMSTSYNPDSSLPNQTVFLSIKIEDAPVGRFLAIRRFSL